MPAESGPANYWRRGYDYRCRSNHGGPRYDYNRASIRSASSVRAAVKAWAAATLSAGAADEDSESKIAADAADNTFGPIKLISLTSVIAPEGNDQPNTCQRPGGQEFAWRSVSGCGRLGCCRRMRSFRLHSCCM
jgi:hypothetical protein